MDRVLMDVKGVMICVSDGVRRDIKIVIVIMIVII